MCGAPLKLRTSPPRAPQKVCTLQVEHVIHTRVGNDGYFYSLPSEEIRREQERNFAIDFARGYVSLDFTGAFAVIRTLNGHADSVAIAIDNLNIEAVMGTVAGDDTVFVALREDISRESFLNTLRDRVPEFDD